MRILFIISLLSAYSFCYSQKQDSIYPNNISLFSEVNVIDAEAGKVLYNMDVLVKGPVIIDIHKHKRGPVKKEAATLIIPSKGKYLLPGLVDCHTHIVFKDELTPYLRYGVTTVFSLGGPAEVLTFRDQVKKGLLDGPNIYAAARIDAVKGDWGGIVFNKTVHSVVDVDTAMNEISREKWDFIKVYNNLTTDEFDKIMRIAKANGIPVIGHGVREPGMEHILSKGMALVAHAEEYIYTMFRDSLDESKIPAAVSVTKKYGAFVCPNLSTFKMLAEQWGDSLNFIRLINEPGNLKYSLNPFTIDSWIHNNPYINKKGSISSMYEFLKKLTYAMYKAKVPLVAGTDSPVIPGCFPGYSLVNDLQLLIDAGMTNADALKAATVTPGKFIQKNIKQPANIGEVKKGYQSDLLLLSGNPLEDIQNLRNVAGVMVRGKWYSKDKLDSLKPIAR